VVHERCVTCLSKGGEKVPIYTDKRTGKKVIQYQIGYKYIPDPERPGKLLKRPKYKTEVVGKSARVARKVLVKREATWEKKKYAEELDQEGPKNQYTFGELMAWYLELPAVKRKRSYDKDVERSKVLGRHFGDMQADKVKPSMVESFQHKMLETKNRKGQKYRPATVNRMIALMKRVFNLAIREDMALKNPCWKVAMLKEDNRRDRILTPEEFGQLRNELPEHIAPIVDVAYYTGMRRGEILNLTWEKVNMKIGFLDLEPKDTKTSEPRRLYFNDVLWDIFKREFAKRGKSAFVFTRKGRPIKSIRDGFEDALKRAKVKNFRFHDLRHTFNTNMRKAGVDQTVIMKLTGHKTLSMFSRYNTVDQDDALEAMRKLDLLLLEQKACESSDQVQTDFPSQKNRGSREPLTN
jgi:integrase